MSDTHTGSAGMSAIRRLVVTAAIAAVVGNKPVELMMNENPRDTL